jgi:hypothetical protein
MLAAGIAFAAPGHQAWAGDLIPTNVASIEAVQAPPAGFNPLIASDATLEAYAYPPRPDALKHPAEFAKWKRAMAVKTTRTFGDLKQTGRYHGPAALTGVHRDYGQRNTTYNSSNWSGFVNLNNLTSYNTKTSFYYIISDLVIPQVTNPTCSGWDYAAEWVGIDGWNSNDVLQAGIGTDAACGNAQTTYAWIEWYPYSESEIPLAVAPGDDMFIEVWDTSSTVGYAYVENISTGQVEEYKLTAPNGYKLVGNSAEWIVEAPGVNGSQATLADFGYDIFWGAAAYNFAGNEFVPGSPTTVQVDMVQGGTTVSIPYLFDSTAFYVVYQ